MDKDAAAYLADTLAKIAECNGGAAGVLSPFQVEGDGSCMFHAVSRALFGVETFYHVLRRKCAEELEANKAWCAPRCRPVLRTVSRDGRLVDLASCRPRLARTQVHRARAPERGGV